ncbi:MAG TPA: proteasome accessory factor PafA2 family protein [Gemmataceae bacterium]|nr:proteasome accessory factor PafA2 family protein [Gemmataceae bacterium]
MNTQAKPFLMGSETEYAASGRDESGALLCGEEVYDLLAEVVRRERRWLPDANDGCGTFLENGARLYLDCGHPEYATPECRAPEQVVCHERAGEELLALARREVLRARPGLRLSVAKNNIDPVQPDEVSYGTHESYTCWVTAEAAAAQLVPHLVSRVVYAGSGALTAHPEGHGFELSQRARHLCHVTGGDTTGERAIFTTRVREDYDGAEGGWVRVHLIGKDSQRSPFGTYLTFAATGLLIEMLNRGHAVGLGLELAEPVQALRTISRDPWLRARVPLLDGRRLTALEIQASYLEECECGLQRGGLPEWAPAAVRLWRETLAGLAKGPLGLADRLDPYCKLLIYEHELLRAGYDWPDLRDALGRLKALRAGHGEEVVAAVLAGSAAGLAAEAVAGYDQALTQSGAGQERVLERLRFAVRLQALDFHYHELGGLYDALRAAGRVRPEVASAADVERATREAPPGGRAAARGACVRELQEGGWNADWGSLWQVPSNRFVDLRDPFAAGWQVVQLPQAGAAAAAAPA